MAATVGIGWIAEEDFAAVVEMCDDRESLRIPWVEWAAKAERLVAQFEAEGFDVMRVPLVPAEFGAWCRETGRRPDGRARSKYAELEAMRLHAANTVS